MQRRWLYSHRDAAQGREGCGRGHGNRIEPGGFEYPLGLKRIMRRGEAKDHKWPHGPLCPIGPAALIGHYDHVPALPAITCVARSS